MDFQKEIRVYLAAGYAALWVSSYEEERAEEEIIAAAKALDRQVWIWELGEGWAVKTGKAKMIDAKDPTSAIKTAIDAPDGTVLVLRDYHPFLKVAENIRKIKSALSRLSATRKTFVFLSYAPFIPPELEKGITPIELTLPNREDLGVILDDVTEAVKETVAASVRSDLIEAACGLTCKEAEDAFARARIVAKSYNAEAIASVQKQKAMAIKKTGLLEVWDQIEPIESLGGLTALKKYFTRSRLAFTPAAKEFGLQRLSGVMLTGVPGTGKSLASKVAASIFQWPLFRLDLGRIFGSLVGMSEERARSSCMLMESVAPAIVWMDEVN